MKVTQIPTRSFITSCPHSRFHR